MICMYIYFTFDFNVLEAVTFVMGLNNLRIQLHRCFSVHLTPVKILSSNCFSQSLRRKK